MLWQDLHHFVFFWGSGFDCFPKAKIFSGRVASFYTVWFILNAWSLQFPCMKKPLCRAFSINCCCRLLIELLLEFLWTCDFRSCSEAPVASSNIFQNAFEYVHGSASHLYNSFLGQLTLCELHCRRSLCCVVQPLSTPKSASHSLHSAVLSLVLL